MPEEQSWTSEQPTNGSVDRMGDSTDPLAVKDDDDDDDTSRDILCGLGSWRPACLQRFANHRVYAFAYIIIGVVQGMIMAYFGGVLTTLEKVFGIKSSVMGLVLSGNDITQIIGGLFINHIGQRGSRPFWLSIGMLTTGASCFMYALTHLLWDSSNYDIIITGHSSSDATGVRTDFCLAEREIATSASDLVNEQRLRTESQSHAAVLTLLFVGQLISGIGSTALFSLGFTYMDDSVKKSNSPMYTGMTSALRCLGPVFGFLLASFCLGLNVKPLEKSRYSKGDPLFIGCWWLGFAILGSLQIAITFPMILFPKMLPSEKRITKPVDQGPKPKDSGWEDFEQGMRRLLKNPVVMSYMISVGPAILGIIGSGIFMPKYLEAQFGQTPAKASVYSGVIGMAMLMIGTFVGGAVLWKFQPRTLYVAAFTSAVDVFHIIATYFMMMIDCGQEEFAGLNLYGDGRYEITSDCSRDCSCVLQFNPVCVGTTNFLSPCLAGCSAIDAANSKLFLNCICTTPSAIVELSSMLNSSMVAYGFGSTARQGYCPGGRSECPYLLAYLFLKGASVLIGSLSRIGNILILIRSVEKHDKSLVLAFMLVVCSLTGFIPGPIIFGAAVDQTCLFWETKSDGEKGHCWVYDSLAFSYWFHGLKILCYVITTVMSFFICYFGRNIDLYAEDDDDVIDKPKAEAPVQLCIQTKPEALTTVTQSSEKQTTF